MGLYLKVEQETVEGGVAPPLPPLMMAYGAETALDFMSSTVSRLKSAELEETLLVLPLDVVQQLVTVLSRLLDTGKEVETVARCPLPSGDSPRTHRGQWESGD